MATPTAPRQPSTLSNRFSKVHVYYGRFNKVDRKLKRLKRGSEAYLDLLPDPSVAAEVLRMKAQDAVKAVDDFAESFPDAPAPAHNRSRHSTHAS